MILGSELVIQEIVRGQDRAYIREWGYEWKANQKITNHNSSSDNNNNTPE